VTNPREKKSPVPSGPRWCLKHTNPDRTKRVPKETCRNEDPANRLAAGEWQAARETLLVKEKELTRALDAMAAERRRMPWMAVEKDYRFEGPNGPASLADLFEGAGKLIVYRAFYAPDVTTYPESGGAYPERACIGCSFGADQVRTPGPPERAGHDARAMSRAPPRRRSRVEGAHGLGNSSPGTPSPTTSTRISACTSGTGTTPSSVRAIGSSAPTSSTPAATRS
jgi:hypothetical protein